MLTECIFLLENILKSIPNTEKDVEDKVANTYAYTTWIQQMPYLLQFFERK